MIVLRKKTRLLFPALLLPLLLSSCLPGTAEEKNRRPLSRSGFHLGTSCLITLFDWAPESDPEALLDEAFLLLSRLEGELSAKLPESALSRLNRAGSRGADPGPVVKEVLESALELASWSGGLFDPSLGRVIELWGIGTPEAAVPSEPDLRAALATVGYDRIRIGAAGQVFLEKEGMRLDLGGIAKGYAADRIKTLLEEKGVRGAIVNLGGNVLTMGKKPAGGPWLIGIQDPREPRGTYLGILETGEDAVVTSGIYERFFQTGEQRYHHILDSATGFPADNGVVSVTVVHPRSIRADGLSTALFAMGVEKAMAAASELEDTGVILVDRDNRVYLTDNLKDRFHFTSGTPYRPAP